MLIAYTNADWARSVDEWKSTSGGAFFLGDRLVSWFGKKQDLVSLSTAKEEYITVASCYSWVIWMRQTLKDIEVTYDEEIYIMCDNTSSINISKNPLMHSRAKHFLIKVVTTQGRKLLRRKLDWSTFL